MSSFTDRIRARTRRHNERQARTQPHHARREVAAEFAPLSLDVDQVAAIKRALGQTPIDETILQELVREGKLTWAEVTAMSATELGELAAEIERYKRRTTGTSDAIVVPAPPGNAPGEFDLGQLEESGTAAYMAPEQPDPEQLEQPAAPTEPAEAEALPPAPPIRRAEFKSSNVRAAELGADGTLLVTFADGAIYAYGNFTLEQFEEWEKAKSAGSWFHNNVRQKPERHPARKA